MRRWSQLAVLAVLAVVAAEVVLRARHEEPGFPQGEAPAAPELVLKTLSGTAVDLKALRGKVVAVNFWATWCGPCRAEIPQLAALWRERQGRCFEVLGVAGLSGRPDTERMARDIPYPVLFDEDGEAVDAWSIRAVPRTFVLDPEGRIRKVFPGAVSHDELARAVDPLLPSVCPGG